MSDQRADLEWRGAVPVSRQFDDPYYSLENGLAETRHVFLAGNDLPERFCDGFHVAELGFGTGLNLAVTLQAFRAAQTGGVLHMTSFEAFPMSPEEMRTALAAFDGVRDVAPALIAAYEQDPTRIRLPDLDFTMIHGDARTTLPRWQGQADAWFLDGFSPAKNPELWEPSLMQAVAQHTKPGGTCATYTAAGFVRRGLEDAGFEITRVPGYGRKRHMTRGVLR